MGKKSERVQARIDEDLKSRVVDKLNKMGLDQSSAINLLFSYIDTHNRLPFRPKIPNEETVRALEEAEGEDLEEFDDLESLNEELFEN